MEDIEKIITHLPSLVRRIGSDKVKEAKCIALDHGGELKRIRRSRHWQLISDINTLKEITEGLSQKYPEEMQYVIIKLKQQLEKCGPPPETTEEALARLINENPNITLAELMSSTDCTISEARTARFVLESF